MTEAPLPFMVTVRKRMVKPSGKERWGVVIRYQAATLPEVFKEAERYLREGEPHAITIIRRRPSR